MAQAIHNPNGAFGVTDSNQVHAQNNVQSYVATTAVAAGDVVIADVSAPAVVDTTPVTAETTTTAGVVSWLGVALNAAAIGDTVLVAGSGSIVVANVATATVVDDVLSTGTTAGEGAIDVTHGVDNYAVALSDADANDQAIVRVL